jgi:hypothetical protein
VAADLFHQSATMAENLGAGKFCVHQAMSDAYVAGHVLSIDSDESSKLLF